MYLVIKIYINRCISFFIYGHPNFRMVIIMKGLLIDKNKFEAFVSLQDGLIISVPLSSINKDTIGSTIDFSCEYSNRKIPHNDFIDFF